MRYLKTNTTYCFSPPVMIATFFIEIGLALYVVWRYKLNEITRLAVALLFFLSVFQLAEYNVCEGSFGIDSLSWARLGYVAITMLPPIGFHLATKIAGQKQRGLVAFAYAAGVAFALFFAFSGDGITSPACLGNYVIFKSAPGSVWLYTLYYYGWLILTTVYAFTRAKAGLAKNKARALKSLAIGYTAFVLPTTAVNIIDPSTISGIPSIMCGFAVILAVILAGAVLPQYYRVTTLGGLINGKTKK